MLENVKGILSSKFDNYRLEILNLLGKMGYKAEWKLLNSSDYGVSQLRPRAVLVALKEDIFQYFQWPEKHKVLPPTIGELLISQMSALGWNATEWAK